MNMSNPKETWEALKKLDFYLAIDLWHHPTVENADIILPAAHWLELDSTRMSQGSSGGAGATCQCIQPPAEAKPDIEIAQLLFKAMGKPWSPRSKESVAWR
jgi:anaerobic selenocysteine-containing dehydrogenase